MAGRILRMLFNKVRNTLSVILCTLLVLPGCDVNDSQVSDNQDTEVNPEMNLKPPQLIVKLDGESLKAKRGVYSWSEGESGIEASSEAPIDLLKSSEPHLVNQDTAIELEFDREPDDYEIKIWHDPGLIERVSDFDLSLQQGEVVYEVLAHWPQGKASYAFKVLVE